MTDDNLRQSFYIAIKLTLNFDGNMLILLLLGVNGLD